MKGKKVSKIDRSVVCRIPISLHANIKKRGDGDFRTGLIKTNTICEHVETRPEQIIMEDVDNIMLHLQQYYGDNHYSHFDNFPAFMRNFLNRGIPNYSILNSKQIKKKEGKVDGIKPE